MQRSIEEARKAKSKNPDILTGVPVATVATTAKKPYEAKIGERPPCKERKAKARDARACARGRLPVGTRFNSKMISEEAWECEMMIPIGTGFPLTRYKTITHIAKGLFQCLEECDLMYRKWLKENRESSAQSEKEADQSS